jgi:hypothetical protein
VPDAIDPTERVRALFATPPDDRDDGWRDRFLADVADARVGLTQTAIAPGPDGLPYGRVHLAPPASSVATTTVRRLVERATERGYGLVVSATPLAQGSNSWVFRYGDLWSLRAYGRFGGDRVDGSDAGHDDEHADPSEVARGRVLEAAPSETLFPRWARRVVGKWLFDRLGVIEPRAKLFVVPESHPSRNFVFNVDVPVGTSTPEHSALLALGGWFLPPGIGLVTLPPSQPFEIEPSIPLLDDFA